MKFRKKPVVIDAVLWSGDNVDAVSEFLGATYIDIKLSTKSLFIHTLEGVMEASQGDWIIRGVRGEFYPCKPDIFDATYDPA